MSDLEKQELQQKILELEQDIRKLQQNLNDDKNTLKAMKEKLQILKDIAWDRQSKRESSSMYKVLKGEKDYTKVQSDIGRVKVDKDFMEKEIQKHLDDPNLRGMVTKQEMLSFPKVAKNVKPKFDERHRGYNWKALANDGSTLNYGERDWGEGSRLLTAHSETGRGERGQLRQEFNDRNFHNPASDTIIPQNPNESQISLENSHNQAQEPKQPRADEILFNGYKEIRKEQESSITQTTQQASVDGDIDTNTSPRGHRR